jgi:hypothetical protein
MKLFISCCVMALLVACTNVPPHEADYQSVAEKLVALEPCEPQYCSGVWYPLDRPRNEESDPAAAQLAASECVVKLRENTQHPRPHSPQNQPGLAAGRAPTEVIAAAQIVTCMREKGWQYFVEGTVG